MSTRSRAAICRELNGPILVEDIVVEDPQEREVLVEMKACGVCHSDHSATNGTLRMELPLILGHEGAGVVTRVGKDVTEFQVSDHVLTTFISMCGKCRYCQTGRPQLCEQGARTLYTLPDGSLRTRDAQGQPLNILLGCGAMSQFQTVHQDNLVKIDADIPMDRAALISCGVVTGYGAAVNTAQVRPGSRVVVFGLGGVGISAIQGARIAGAAQVVAVDTNPDKLEFARSIGATDTVDASSTDKLVRQLRELTDGGADYAFDCVGHASIVEQAFGCLAKGGTTVEVGVAPAVEKAQIRCASLTFEEKTLTGSFYGSARPRADFPALAHLYRSGQLKLDELVTRTYSIEEAPQAFDDLLRGVNIRGVIVF